MFFLLPPKWAAENKPARQAVSGGPYKLASFTPGDSIVLEPNPKYWGPKPAYAKITFRVIPEASSRIAALLAGLFTTLRLWHWQSGKTPRCRGCEGPLGRLHHGPQGDYRKCLACGGKQQA